MTAVRVDEDNGPGVPAAERSRRFTDYACISNRPDIAIEKCGFCLLDHARYDHFFVHSGWIDECLTY